MSQEQLKPDLSGFDAFDVLKQGRKARATQPEPPVSPSIHEQDAKAYKSILDEARAVLGLSDGDSLVAAIQRLATQPEQADGGEAVASIYVTPGGDREFDDWKCDLPAGRNILYTHPAPAASVSDEKPVRDPDALPKGFVPLQRENGKLVYAACLDGGRYHGWLMWKHPDGQWVTKRKMTSLEVMQAEDQDHYGIVQDAGKENP